MISRQYLDMFYFASSKMTSLDMIFTYLIAGVFLYFWHLRKYKNIGLNKGNVRMQALKAAAINTVEGFFGGIIATLIVVMLGIVVDVDKINIAVFVSLILGMVSSNFLNLIYGCSIVCLFIPQGEMYSFISVAYVMIFVQGMLILFSGVKDFVPIVSKNENDENFGGYISNRIWPVSIGIVCLVANNLVSNDELISSGVISTPKGWPLFFSTSNNKAFFIITSLFAFIGSLKTIYTKTKRQSNTLMGFAYMTFGVVFLYITYIFKTESFLPYFLVLLSISAYSIFEIFMNDTAKTKGKKFVARDKVVVLDVLTATLADYANIKPMDKILSINSIKAKSVEMYNNIIKDSLNYNIVVDRNGENININVQIEMDEDEDEYEDRPKNLYDLGIIAISPNLKTD